MRGTPILLQLFVLYYGLAAAIRLPAWMAALLGYRFELRRVRK
jgi:ABC-type amino acid transport system permease subunit